MCATIRPSNRSSYAISDAGSLETRFGGSGSHFSRRACRGNALRPIHDDRQPRATGQLAERAAELADDERRLWIDPLLEADADQPRKREEPPYGVGHGAG